MAGQVFIEIWNPPTLNLTAYGGTSAAKDGLTLVKLPLFASIRRTSRRINVIKIKRIKQMKKIFLFLIPILVLLISCQPKEDQSLTEEEAKVILDRFMETVMNTDTTLAEEMLHPDCILRYPVLPEPIKGIDNYKNFIKNTANTFSEFEATIEEVNVKGDKIWCRYTMTGINTGPLGELPATGKRFQVTGMAITRIVDGKIIEDETYWNVLGFYQQLGFTLSPPKVEID